jgi:hypothetical protein
MCDTGGGGKPHSAALTLEDWMGGIALMMKTTNALVTVKTNRDTPEYTLSLILARFAYGLLADRLRQRESWGLNLGQLPDDLKPFQFENRSGSPC